MVKVVAVFLAMCLVIAGCGQDNSRQSRLEKADSILIGVAYSAAEVDSDTHFYKGVEMAVEELNKSSGVLNKKVKIIKKDDSNSVTEGAAVARSFANNPDIAAVIGHWDSNVTGTVAQVYDKNNLLMITPAATAPLLTKKGHKMVFRKVPDDAAYGEILAEYALIIGLERVVIYYADNETGLSRANAFEDKARRRGIEIVDRIAYINDKQLELYFQKWQALNFNAVFVADDMYNTGRFIRLLRNAQINVPVLCSNDNDRNGLVKYLGAGYANSIIIPTAFSPLDNAAETQKFVKAFQDMHGSQPDMWAAQGYETIKLYAFAVEQAGSASPDKVAAVLRSMSGWKGVTGSLSCTGAGDITGDKLYIKQLKNGKYEFLAY